MGWIKLEGMEFYAYHGYYAEERTVGNKYNVDIAIKADLNVAAANDKLSQTVNYEQIYAIVRMEMSISAKLLEHLAQRIAEKAMIEFPSIKKIHVGISKFNPPLGGICRAATVVYTQKRGKRH